jgi:hypothetical protein
MSITPQDLQKLLDEREASRASRKRAWENLQEIRWVIQDVVGSAATGKEDERNRDQLYDLVTGSGPAWFNAIRTSLPFFPASSREVMGFSYHRLDCLVKDRFTSPHSCTNCLQRESELEWQQD